MNLVPFCILQEEIFTTFDASSMEYIDGEIKQTDHEPSIKEESIYTFFIVVWNRSNNKFLSCWTVPGSADLKTGYFEFPDYLFSDPLDFYKYKSTFYTTIRESMANKSNLFTKTPKYFNEQILIYKMSSHLSEMTL